MTVRITDSEGTTVPRTHNLINYKLTGPGEIIAVGNGDPTSLVSFQSLNRKAFNGLAMVIIRSKADESGTIELVAESEGLTKSVLQIESVQ